MIRFLLPVCLGFLLSTMTSAAEFSDVRIDSKFKKYVEADPLLMELTGAKILVLPDGKYIVLAVASTVLKDGSPRDRLRAERVCRPKALAYFIGDRDGVQIVHLERSVDKTRIEVKAGKETAESVSEYLELTKAKTRGIAKAMPVIGRWKSEDGAVFSLAIGTLLDKDGEVIRSQVTE
jgi:hypothetical protein